MPSATKALGPPLTLRPNMGRNGQLLAMVRHHGPPDETGMAIVVGMPVVASGQLGDTGNPNTCEDLSGEELIRGSRGDGTDMRMDDTDDRWGVERLLDDIHVPGTYEWGNMFKHSLYKVK